MNHLPLARASFVGAAISIDESPETTGGSREHQDSANNDQESFPARKCWVKTIREETDQQDAQTKEAQRISKAHTCVNGQVHGQ